MVNFMATPSCAFFTAQEGVLFMSLEIISDAYVKYIDTSLYLWYNKENLLEVL